MREDEDLVDLGSACELTQGSFMMDYYESLVVKDHWAGE